MRTEKEKMLSAEYYNPSDKLLVADRKKAEELLKSYNRNGQQGKRGMPLTEILGKENRGMVKPPFACTYGYNIQLGKGFRAEQGCCLNDCNSIVIGENVILGEGVKITTLVEKKDKAVLEMAYPVRIGNNVYIGDRTVVCSGVSIGDNVIIAPGSVVSIDIPDNVIAAGTPCRAIQIVPPLEMLNKLEELKRGKGSLDAEDEGRGLAA